MKYMYKISSIRSPLDICIKASDIPVYLVYKISADINPLICFITKIMESNPN